MTTKNFGAGVSEYLDVDGRNFETTVYQASKPVLDAELNLVQDINQARSRTIFQLAQSGWLAADVTDTSSHSSGIFTTSAVANQLAIPTMKAIVNGWPLTVDSTNATTANTVDLGTPPVSGLRSDLVILEVWRRLLSASPSTVGKSQSARIWKNGNVKIQNSDDVSLNFVDDILDGAVGSETTKRVQIQYRLRVIQGINIDSYPSGIADPTVVAFSVPASPAAPDGTTTAFAYSNQSAAGDAGLWRAGDGVPTNGLGTVDGYMYALPLSVIFRRNSTAFNRDTNQNGGSGRPDSFTATIINARDVMDLRPNVSLSSWNLEELLQKNVNFTLDNTLRVEQETTPLAGGSRGHTNIWADEIGPTDNPGAQRIRGGGGKGFDSACRRISDRPILETIVLHFVPADVGDSDWDDAEIDIDPSGGGTNFEIYPYGSANFLAAAPDNIVILDVLNWVGADTTGDTMTLGFFDDTAGTGAINAPDVQAFKYIASLGLSGTAVFRMGANFPPTQDLYVTVLVSYPGGSETTAGGLTRTPTGDFGASSFVNETPAQLPASAPYLFNSMVTSFDQPHREILVTYKTLSHTFSQLFSLDNSLDGQPANTGILFIPERVATSPTPVITNVTQGTTYTGAVTISNDGRLIFVSSLVGAWSPGINPGNGDQINVSYQSIRPIPNNNVQFTIYYETRAAQTLRDALLGTTLTVIPRYVAPHLYTIVTGSGSLDEAYPFPQQYVQAGAVYPGSGGSFVGDHELDGDGHVSIANFDAQTGFLQIPSLIPAVADPQSLTFTRTGGDIDAERRSFFKGVSGSYIPSAFGQPLSDDKRHKNVLPMIAELSVDGAIGPKGTLLLVLLSRWTEFDDENFVGFNGDLTQNFTAASVYRLKGNPLNSRRS